MSSDSNVTGGPWHTSEDRSPIVIQNGEHSQDITICTISGSKSNPSSQADAKLITTAVNSCFTVSPSDPQAAAAAYGEIVRILENARHWIDNEDLCMEINVALAKVGRGGVGHD